MCNDIYWRENLLKFCLLFVCSFLYIYIYISSIYKLIICICLSSFIFAACLLPEIISSKIFQFEIWFSKFFFFLFKFQFNLIKSYLITNICCATKQNLFVDEEGKKRSNWLSGILFYPILFLLIRKKKLVRSKSWEAYDERTSLPRFSRNGTSLITACC